MDAVEPFVLCPVPTKRGFVTRKEANDEAARLSRLHGQRFYVHRCGCFRFHLTRTKQGDRPPDHARRHR